MTDDLVTAKKSRVFHIAVVMEGEVFSLEHQQGRKRQLGSSRATTLKDQGNGSSVEQQAELGRGTQNITTVSHNRPISITFLIDMEMKYPAR